MESDFSEDGYQSAVCMPLYGGNSTPTMGDKIAGRRIIAGTDRFTPGLAFYVSTMKRFRVDASPKRTTTAATIQGHGRRGFIDTSGGKVSSLLANRLAGY
jgi:hypothetical protein